MRDNDEERRKIDELVARYEFEPELRDIYVEGQSDQVLIEWVLELAAIKNVSVYEISTVAIPSALVVAHGLNDNNRNRVIALAHELVRKSKVDLVRQVACIADADMDFIYEKSFCCPILLSTDYTSMDLYLFNERVLTKFASLVGRLDVTANDIISYLTPILHELFLIRVANHKLQLNLQSLDFSKTCKVSRRKILFDRDEYVQRYLNKNSKWDQRDEFLATIEEFRKKLARERRHYIHGHDMVNLLYWYTSTMKTKLKFDLQLFSRSLMACIDYHALIKEPLFQTLLLRFSD